MAQHITTINQIRERTVENELAIEESDILPFDHGTGSMRHRAFTVGELIAYLKARKLDGMYVGPNEIGKIENGTSGPKITSFYSIDGNIIEATTEFKLGGSEWKKNGSDLPVIEGLYSLGAGTVDSANVNVDRIDSHGIDGEGQQLSVIEIKKRLVKDALQTDEKLLLGPTEVGGDLKVTGAVNPVSGLTLTEFVWNATQEQLTIAHMTNDLQNGQIAVIINNGNSDVTFQATTGSPNPRAFTVPHDAAVMVVKSGDRVYPIGGVL